MSYFKSSRQLNNVKGHEVKRKIKGIGLACGIALSGMVFFSPQEAYAEEVTYTDGDFTADLASNVETPEESYGLTSEVVGVSEETVVSADVVEEVVSVPEENVGSVDVVEEVVDYEVTDNSSSLEEGNSKTTEISPNGVSSVKDVNLSSIFSEEDESTQEESYTVLRNVTSTSNNENIVVNIVTNDNELVNGASSITSTINLNINEELNDVTLVHYYLAGQNDEPLFGELKTTDLVLGTTTKQNNDDFNSSSFVNPSGTKKPAEKAVITFVTIPQGSYISINSTLTSGGASNNDLYRYILDPKELETGILYKSVVEFYDKEGTLLKREVADGVLDIAEFGAWDTKFRVESNSKRLDSRSSSVVNKELEGTGYAVQEYIRDVDGVIPTKLIVLAQPSDEAVKEVGSISDLPNVHFDYNYIRPVGTENILSKSYNTSTIGSPKEKLIVGYKVSNALYNTYNLRYTSTNKNSSPTFINGEDTVILDFDTSNGKGAYRPYEFNSDLVISLKDEKLQEYTKDNLPDLVITPVVYALTESGYVLVAEGETRTYEVGGVVYDVGSKQVTPTGIYKAYTAIDITTDRELDEHGQLTDESISESSIFYEVNVLDGTETKLVARTLSSVGARDLSTEEYLTNDVYKNKVVYLHSGAPRMADGTKGGFDAVGSSSSYFNRVSNVFSKIKDISFVTVDSPTSSRLVLVNDKYIDYSLIYNSKSSAISTLRDRNYSSTENYFSEISYKNIGDTEYTVTTLEGLYTLDISNLEDIRFKLSDSSLLFNQEYDNLGVVITWETDIENVEDISTELGREYLNYKVSDYHLDLPSTASSTLRSVVINHTTNIIAETVDTVGYQSTQRGGRSTDTEYLVRISDVKEEKDLEVTTRTDNRSVLEGQSSMLTGGVINKTKEPQFTAGYVVPKELADLITGYSATSPSQKYSSGVTSVDLTDDWSYITFGDYTKGSGVELGKISKLDVVSLFSKDFAQFDIDAGTLSTPIYQVKYADKDSLVTETETTITTYTTKKDAELPEEVLAKFEEMGVDYSSSQGTYTLVMSKETFGSTLTSESADDGFSTNTTGVKPVNDVYSQINLYNLTDMPYTDTEFYIPIPYKDDRFESETTPLFLGLESVPEGYTVYYSTDPYGTSHENRTYSTTLPADTTTVTALKVVPKGGVFAEKEKASIVLKYDVGDNEPHGTEYTQYAQFWGNNSTGGRFFLDIPESKLSIVQPVGDVVARYVIVDTEEEIAKQTVVKPETEVRLKESYQDTPPKYIEYNSTKYELVRTREKTGDAKQTGTVIEGRQTITYEYQVYVPKEGHAVVRYFSVDAGGNVVESIKEQASITPADGLEDGESYTSKTDSLKPTHIEFGNKVYQLVSVGGTNKHAETDGKLSVSGYSDEASLYQEGKESEDTIVADITKVVNYYYEEVIKESSSKNLLGKVYIHYVDTKGDTIKSTYLDTPDEVVKVVTTVTTKTISGGKAVDSSNKEIAPVVTEKDVYVPYNTSERSKKPNTVDYANKTYYIVENGSMVDGTGIKRGVKSVNTSTSNEDGSVTKYTDIEIGNVVHGVTHVTYVYDLPKTENKEENHYGKVIVHYVDLNGKELKVDYLDTDSTVVAVTTTTVEKDSSGKVVNEKSNRVPNSVSYTANEEGEMPETLTVDGTVYYLVNNNTMSDGTRVIRGIKQDNSTTGELNSDSYVRNTTAVSGTVVQGETHITYVYAPGRSTDTTTTTLGQVVVHFVDVDDRVISSDYKDTPYTVLTETTTTVVKDANGNTVSTNDVTKKNEVSYVIEETEVPKKIRFQGEDYYLLEKGGKMTNGTTVNTKGIKSEVYTSADGKDVFTTLDTGDVVEGTTHITYVYTKAVTKVVEEPITGSVVIRYIRSEDGEFIKPEYKDTTNAVIATKVITQKVHPVTGEVLDSSETYRYSSARYNAADEVSERPNSISYGGTTYYLVNNVDEVISKDLNTVASVENGVLQVNTEGADNSHYTSKVSGNVVEGTTIITYVYDKASGTTTVTNKLGSVKIHYVDLNGTVIKDVYTDTDNGIISTTTTTATYDARGGRLNDKVETSLTNATYNTTEEGEKPTTIDVDGVTYYLVTKTSRMSDGVRVINGIRQHTSVSGNERYTNLEEDYLKEGTTNIVYVYAPATTKVIETEVTGSLSVHYVRTEDGTPIKTTVTPYADVVVAKDVRTVVTDPNGNIVSDTTERVPVVATYDSIQSGVLRPETITHNGEVYYLVTGDSVVTSNSYGNIPTKDGVVQFVENNILATDWVLDTEGNLVAEKELNIAYPYAKATTEVTSVNEEGRVVVHYIDTYGNFIKDDYLDTDLVVVKTTTTTVITDPNGKEVDRKVEVSNSPVSYNTTEDGEKPTVITYNGKTYKLQDGINLYSTLGAEKAQELYVGTDETGMSVVSGVLQFTNSVENNHYTSNVSGEVLANGTVHVTYVYDVVVGDVVARYVVENTEKEIKDSIVVKEGEDVGKTYTDTPPSTIKFEDRTYELVRVREKEGDAPKDGTVKEITQTITYEYKEVVGNVEVHYHIIDETGKVTVRDAKEFNQIVKDGSLDSNYSSIPVKSPTIEVGGITYELVEERTDGDKEEGTVTRETKVINYYYREVPKVVEEPEPTPEPQPEPTPTPEPTKEEPEVPTEEEPEVPTEEEPEVPTKEEPEVPTEEEPEVPTEEEPEVPTKEEPKETEVPTEEEPETPTEEEPETPTEEEPETPTEVETETPTEVETEEPTKEEPKPEVNEVVQLTKKPETPLPVKAVTILEERKETLPNTGDGTSWLGAIGVLNILGASVITKRRKK